MPFQIKADRNDFVCIGGRDIPAALFDVFGIWINDAQTKQRVGVVKLWTSFLLRPDHTGPEALQLSLSLDTAKQLAMRILNACAEAEGQNV